MFGADITHSTIYGVQKNGWFTNPINISTMGICIYWMSRQVMNVWEKVQLRCSGQYFTLISFANN